VSGSAWDWALGLSPAFDVDGQTLGAFLERLGREMHWRFRFSPPSVEAMAAAIVLHGSLAGLEPEEALEAALATSGLRAERRTPHACREAFRRGRRVGLRDHGRGRRAADPVAVRRPPPRRRAA
jgi:hypothetical protein